MDTEYWSAVRSLRLGIADVLESLDVQEWDAPSLCRGWRVRDVAGHVAVVTTITTWRMLAVAPVKKIAPRPRGSISRAASRPARKPE